MAVVALIAAAVQIPAIAVAADNAAKLPPPQRVEPVPLVKVEVERPAPKAAQPSTASPAAAWPRPGKAEIDLPAASAQKSAPEAKAPGLPLTVASLGQDQAVGGPSKVKVGLSDRAAAATVGLDGVLVDLEPVAGSPTPDKARVQLDYKAFRESFGADWGSRLTFVQLPSCALTTPDQPECRTTTPVAASNDNRAGTLTAEVAVAAPGGRPSDGTVKASFAQAAGTSAAGATVLAAVAGASGPEGSYKATSLSASSTWSVSGNSGSFNWSYPIQVPPVPGDLTPQVALTYSSAAIDGRTASTNNQSSWIGDGWDYNPGFIERSYTGCAADKGSGSNAPDKGGDLCWKSDNATISLNGSSSALVRDDASGTWKLSNDDGSRVEKLNGTASDTANGDTDNEYWKVTTTDGTQYFFGKNRLPGWASGKPETGSALTVPVFGNQPGEPGYAPAFKDSWRDRAWRWQLDYVVDPHGNATAYFYDQEKNAYARNSGAVTATPKADALYTRAATLNRIEYGHRAGQVYNASPAGKVAFSTADRCTAADCSFTKANAAYWYDTPVDQSCDKGEDCRNGAPTFWSKRRLTGISTQALQGDGSYRDIDSWSLDQDFPATGSSGGRALWLKSITRTAKAGTAPLVLQPVTFGHGNDPLPNRVDSDEGRSPLYRFRITRITSETGSNTDITYTAADCVAGALPSPDSNTRRCYPSWWTPEGAVDPVLDWFHKYLVEKVTEHDLVAGSGSPDKVTSYEYLDGAAWRRDTSEFTADKERTWNDFRGYQRVRTRVGDSARSLSETVYFRGMDGDTLADGKPRPVSPLRGVKDSNELAGFARETIVYDKDDSDGGKPLTSTVNEPWLRGTASRAVKALPSKDGKPTTTLPAEPNRPEATALPPVTATMVRTVSETTTALQPDGSTARTLRQSRTFDDYGQVTTVSDEGDTGVTGDEQCTRTTYVTPDTANWLVSYPQHVQTTSTLCSDGATPTTVTSEARTAYDGRPLGAAPEPGKGNATTTESVDRYDGATPHYQTVSATTYDQYGRATSVRDVNNAETTTSYTPASGSQATVVQSTNPKKFTTTTTYDGLRAQPVKVVDANNRTTYVDYDALGRTTAVWNPGRDKSASPNATYTYTIEPGKQPAITTRTLLENGAYRTGIALYDGLLRSRQVQEQAYDVDGGRNITDSFYDSHGRVYRTNVAYHTTGAPEAVLWIGLDNKVPSQTETEFDGLDRPTASIFKSLNKEQWRTTTRYGVNWGATTPPEGGTPTLTITDARGRTSEVRHYKTGSPDIGADASAYEALKYTYNPAGKLTRFTDAAGNAWTWEYDLLGRQTKAVDPDRGTTTSTYNPDGTLATVTDARGRTLAYTYDILGRKTAMFDGSTTGTKLTEWAYDTLPGSNGMATGSTRWENGKAYTTGITGFDGAARPLGSTVTIPDSEGALAGTYTTSQTYTPNTGLADTTTYPAAGGLPQEGIHRNYTLLGLPTTVSDGSNRVYSHGNSYDAYGQVTQSIAGPFGSRAVQSYVYEDATKRLALVRTDRDRGGPQVLDKKVYTYNQVGNITRVRDDRDNAAVTDTQCYTYDFAQRLTNAWSATDDCVARPTPTSSPYVGGVDPYWTSYTYDAAGNRTQATNRTSGAAAGPLMDTTKVSSVAIAGDGQTASVAIAEGQAYLAQQRANGTWRNYENLHTTTQAGALTAPVEHVAAAWADNTLQIMTVAGGRIWHTLRKADGSWQPWGDVTGVVGPIADPNQLSLSATASGLEVLTLSDGVLKHTVRKPNGQWEAWGNVYGETGSLTGATRITSAATGTGLEVMVIAGDKLWHTIRYADASWQKWGDVYGVTGELTSSTGISATATGAGLEVAVIAGGSIWHTVRNPAGSWQQWGNVSAAVGRLDQMVSAAVVSSSGNLKLIAAAGGVLNYTKRDFTTGSWLPWAQLTQTTENQQSDQTQRSSTYPAAGGTRPHALSRVDITGTGARTDTFTYDEAGNTVRRVTADGDQSLEWDTEGHLAKSTTAGKSTTFLYDANGNRLLRREPAAVTLYLDGQELKLDKVANKVTGTRYISLVNATLVKGSDGSLNYLINDRQGTAQLTIDGDSLAATRGDTTAFGTLRGKKPASWPSERGFVGGTNDATTGLTHLGAREYDAENGRFISVDPVLDLTDPQQINGYAYSNSNPVNLSDPNGLRPEGVCGGFGTCYDDKGYVTTETFKLEDDGTWTENYWNQWSGSREHPNVVSPHMHIVHRGGSLKENLRGAFDALQYVPGLNVIGVAGATFMDVADGKYMNAVQNLAGVVPGGRAVSLTGKAGKAFSAAEKAETIADRASDALALLACGGSPDGAPHSFPPGTRVLLADGTTQTIESLRLGDQVQATDPTTGETESKSVVRTIRTPDDEHFTDLQLQVDSPDGAAGTVETLTSTQHHPFWDETTRQWTDAADLTPGDTVRTIDGRTPTVLSVRNYDTAPQVAYDLTIADLHTYYVLAGATPILVHNCGETGDEAAQEAQETLLHGPFHRKASPTQTDEHARLQQENGELWGGLSRLGGDEAAKAHIGPLPDGARGVEFYTTIRPREAFPGYVWWEVGRVPGVRLENGFAKIPILISKNTQIG
ncbi:polymorphic toxin-type HINT domain-containing protein [Kitasatospora sp. NPDC018619]|uniref:polymorphic toxin-type HINT domain-containing protein n=1 Tax=unclassified Kitasatospora TaxID=2633591 RepID=UPI0037A1FEB7